MKAASLALLLVAGPMLIEGQKADWDPLDQQIEQLYLKGDLPGAVRIAKLALDAASIPSKLAVVSTASVFSTTISGNLKDGETVSPPESRSSPRETRGQLGRLCAERERSGALSPRHSPLPRSTGAGRGSRRCTVANPGRQQSRSCRDARNARVHLHRRRRIRKVRRHVRKSPSNL